MNAGNATQVVKTGVLVFMIGATFVSLIQEFDFSHKPQEQDPNTPPPISVPENGTKIDGLTILTTDSFRKPFTKLLADKEYNVDMKEYPFEGQEYYLNLFLTHGHVLVVFFLMSRYQSSNNESSKTKIMMVGMVLVLAWLFASPHLKTERLGLEYKGQQVYTADEFNEEKIWAKVTEYEEMSTFGLEPTPSAPEKTGSSEGAPADDFVGEIDPDF